MAPIDPIDSMNVRELDRRTSDRIDVRLLWREHDNRALVAVADDKTGERFTVEVRDGERALDVFHHPFAYAAWHGVDEFGGGSEPERAPVNTTTPR